MEWHFWVGPKWLNVLGGSLLLAVGLFGLIREYFRAGAEPAPEWRKRRILVGIALAVIGVATLISAHWVTQ